MRILPLRVLALLFLVSLFVLSSISFLGYSQPNSSDLTQVHYVKKYYPFPPAPSNVSLSGKTGEVNLHAYYSGEPAPMGIADYGVGPYGPYKAETTQILGSAYVGYLSVTSPGGNPEVAFQLNGVLNYKAGGHTYALWVQDVLVYNTETHSATVSDNVWNFTSPYAGVDSLHGNGGISTYGNQTFYAYTYSTITLVPPFTFYLLVNVTVNAEGQPVVLFWANLGNGWVNFDQVTATNAKGASDVYFLVDGGKYTGSGNMYDIEFVMGGVDGTATLTSSFVFMTLQYWNGHNFQQPLNAYNFGSDTSETVANAVDLPYYLNKMTGTLQAGITAGNGGLDSLWNFTFMGSLTVNAPVDSGYILVYLANYGYNSSYVNDAIPFTGYGAKLSLLEGDYAVLVYNQERQLVGEAVVNVQGGVYEGTGVANFSISLDSSPVYVTQEGQESVPVEVSAYGGVQFSLYVSGGIQYSYDNSSSFQGNGTEFIQIRVTSLPPGTYYAVLTATLFPGFSKTLEFPIVVLPGLERVTFNYSYVGDPPPYPPTVTLYFPNGTVKEFALPFSVLVPSGTNYTAERSITLQGVRWATKDYSGEIPTTPDGLYSLNLVYYEQDLVTFSFSVVGGGDYGQPEIEVETFGTFTNVLPGTYWVDFNSSYSYPYELPYSTSTVRWAATNYQGVITSPGKVEVTYYLQYFVKVIGEGKAFALVNGVNKTLSTGWYNAGSQVQIEQVPYYLGNGERVSIVGASPAMSFVVNSPMTVTLHQVIQYYVKVESKVTAFALVNGENTTISSGWYNSGTKIEVENIILYLSPDVRFALLNVTPSTTFTVTSPTTLVLNYVEQFFVNVSPSGLVNALINGKSTTLTSGWYNEGSNVTVYPYVQYEGDGERVVVVSVYPSNSFEVNGPTTVEVNAVVQYYVSVNSQVPVYALVNGTNRTLVSGWYNSGTRVEVENITYYPSPDTRYLIVGIEPSAFTVKGPTQVSVSVEKQFLLQLNVDFPIKALIDGTLGYITSDSWFSENTTIQILNQTYYVSKDERIIITVISPLSVTMTKPVTLTLGYVKQYLVNIDGNESWVNAGKTILLNTNLPFYLLGHFVGTYNLPPGAKIVVNGPISEKLKTEPNWSVFAGIAAVGAIIGVGRLVSKRRRAE